MAKALADELCSKVLTNRPLFTDLPKDLVNVDDSEEAFNSHLNPYIIESMSKLKRVGKIITNRRGSFIKVMLTPESHHHQTLELDKLLKNLSNNNCEIKQSKSIDKEDCVPSFSYTNKCLTSISSLDDTTHQEKYYLPPEIKKTLLRGKYKLLITCMISKTCVICYVDVKCDDGTDAFAGTAGELVKCGARVEKNFTKKVTHVIFRNGRNSTFLKAKKEGIPLVSVLWIKKCNKVGYFVDPAQYPPRDMKKYERILPFQTIKKRRLRFFNPNSKIRKLILENLHNPCFVPTQNGRILRARIAAIKKSDSIHESIKNPIKIAQTRATASKLIKEVPAKDKK